VILSTKGCQINFSVI